MDRVASIMSRRVVAIRSDCELSVAVDTFLRSALHHLVVVDPDRTVRGIISAEQVLAALGRTGPPLRLVGEQALTSVPPVHPDDDIRRAAERMLDELVDVVPVAEADGRMVGVVTWRDVVAYATGRSLAP